jgi:hypothetical protein
MTEDYAPYLLVENPFPQVAIVDTKKQDIRVNGSIFREDILCDEVAALRDRLEKRTSMIYVSGLKFDKGIGKSALIVHESRRLGSLPDTTSVVVRCDSRSKPTELALELAKEWHHRGYLWEAMHRILSSFSRTREDDRISPDAIETMFGAYPRPPARLPLTPYTHTTSEHLAKQLSEWIIARPSQVDQQLLENFLKLYLSKPADLPPNIGKIKIRGLDEIDIYSGMLELLYQSGYKDNFVFLDQLEDAIMPVPSSKIGEFCLDFRRILEAGIGKAVMVVTLHPDSEMKLDTQSAQHLLKVAPLDTAHRIDVLALEVARDEAVDLTVEYMNHFRSGTPEYPTFPIRPEVIRYISFLKEGNIRQVLQQLNECLKVGAASGHPDITLEYVVNHHKETMGMLQDPRLYEEFCSRVIR